MKSKISTLLAGTALLCAGSANAQFVADLPLNDANLNTSEYVYFKAANMSVGDDNKGYVSVDEDGMFVPVLETPDTRSEYDAVLWSVKQTKRQTVDGVYYSYALTNKDAKVLSLKLQTVSSRVPLKGEIAVSDDVATLDGTGNSEWLFDKNNGFYAMKGDSIFFLNSDLKLCAVHWNDKGTEIGGKWNLAATKLALVKLGDAYVNLTIGDFNTVMLENGKKLYFNNGKDVSSNETNILTQKTWTAIGAGEDKTNTEFFLADGTKTSIEKNPNVLMVDTFFYDVLGQHSFKLNVDTLIKDPAGVTAYTDLAAKVKKVGNKIIGTARPYESALFSVKMFAKNDSLVLSVGNLPEKVSGKDVYYEGNDVPMKVAAIPTSAIAAIRQLSGTKVLTVCEFPVNDPHGKLYIRPLIQPYKEKQVGGNVNLDVKKVYYIKDMKEQNFDKTENVNKGKFHNSSPIQETNYVDNGQAFNAYNQYVLVKAAGTDSGNYAVYNRGTGLPGWVGKATKEGDAVVMTNAGAGKSDTIKFEVAPITYTGKDAEKSIGYKLVNKFDMEHKAFEIGTLSPFMNNMFMHMKADSTMHIKEGKEMYKLEAVASAEAYGAEVAGIDTLINQAYYIKNAKGEYLSLDDKSGKYILSKDAAKIKHGVVADKTDCIKWAFYFSACDSAESYVLTPAKVTKTKVAADVVKQDIDMEEEFKMLIHSQTGNLILATKADAKNDLFFVKVEEDPASLFTMPKHVQFTAKNKDQLAMGSKNFAVAARVGELKSAYTTEDFTMWLDTARYTRNGKDEITPAYYISKGVLGEDTLKTVKRMYLWASNDSVDAKVKPEQYKFDSKFRAQFREAQRYGVDSLIVANIAKNDTVSDVEVKASKTQSYISKSINRFRYNIQVDRQDVGMYTIKSAAAEEWLQNVNGTIVLTNIQANALRVAVENSKAPTSNEAIEAAAVKVIAGDGVVTVSGAAGKKVVVADVLGRTTTVVATSDNETIAAPQGVVIVSVEGEVAVKAVVK